MTDRNFLQERLAQRPRRCSTLALIGAQTSIRYKTIHLQRARLHYRNCIISIRSKSCYQRLAKKLHLTRPKHLAPNIRCVRLATYENKDMSIHLHNDSDRKQYPLQRAPCVLRNCDDEHQSLTAISTKFNEMKINRFNSQDYLANNSSRQIYDSFNLGIS